MFSDSAQGLEWYVCGNLFDCDMFVQEPAKEEYVVPLSERFRMAYVSRAERIAAKAERNYQQRRRRQLRNDTVLQALARFKFL